MLKPRSRSWLTISLWTFLIIFLLGAGVWGASDEFPPLDWNPRNLASIKAAEPKTLTFAVLGDNRGNLPVLARLLEQMGRDPDLEFAIHLGDMVETGELGNYCGFFRSLRQHLRMPLLAVIGNHELYGDPRGHLYAEFFGPRYFSFHLDGCYFIMVDDAGKTSLDAAQFRWLERELQKAQAYKTRLVFLHVPLFDPRPDGYRHSLPPESGRRLLALFKKYRVSRVFAGHVHGYFDGRWDGVPYTIAAGAGARLYGTDPGHFFYHYLKVSVRGGAVQIQVRRLAKERK
jgi:3',5'-cyclic AMP phosphodiesterase CpdA